MSVVSVSCTEKIDSRIIVVVEDPGALNYLAPLIDRLLQEEVPTLTLGSGVGRRILRDRGYVVAEFSVNDCFDAFFLDSRPAALIVGTSEDPATPSFALLEGARSAGVPTFGIVDACVNAAFRFRGLNDDPLAHAPDWLVVPDTATLSAFYQLGFKRERIRVVSNPALAVARNRGREIRRQFLASTAAQERYMRPRIVFISEVSNGLNSSQYYRSDSYTLFGRGSSRLRTTIVAEELIDALEALKARLAIDPTLVLRLHPKESLDDLGILSEEFDEVSRGGDPLEVVATADLVVGMSSMLLAQALQIGVPCLSILPREQERHWLVEIASGRIECATRRCEVLSSLQNLLSKIPIGQQIGQEVDSTAEDSTGMIINLLREVCGVRSVA